MASQASAAGHNVAWYDAAAAAGEMQFLAGEANRPQPAWVLELELA